MTFHTVFLNLKRTNIWAMGIIDPTPEMAAATSGFKQYFFINMFTGNIFEWRVHSYILEKIATFTSDFGLKLKIVRDILGQDWPIIRTRLAHTD
jgi:hypothetical protein